MISQEGTPTPTRQWRNLYEKERQNILVSNTPWLQSQHAGCDPISNMTLDRLLRSVELFHSQDKAHPRDSNDTAGSESG